jgi:hypothetical protein
VTLIDDYNGTLMFDVPSMSDPEIGYPVYFNTRTGLLNCECLDCVCRGKVGDVEKGGGCKHIQSLLRTLREMSA